MSNHRQNNLIKRELKRLIGHYIKPRLRGYLWKIARRIIDKIVR